MGEFDKLNYDVVSVIFSFLENSAVILTCKYFYRHKSNIVWNYKKQMTEIIDKLQHIRDITQSLLNRIKTYVLWHDEVKYGKHENKLISMVTWSGVINIPNIFDKSIFKKNIFFMCSAKPRQLLKQYHCHRYNGIHDRIPSSIVEFMLWSRNIDIDINNIITKYRFFIWTTYKVKLDNLYMEMLSFERHVKDEMFSEHWSFCF